MSETPGLSDPVVSAVPTSQRILDAAEALFAERGLAGTAVRDIAGRVGLNPASLYNHFASKQDLYEAVLERGIRPLIEMLAEAAAGDVDPQSSDFSDRVIATVMGQLSQTPHLPRLIQHEAVSGGEHLARLARRWLAPIVDQALAAAKAHGSTSEWQEEELPLLVSAWINIVLGHFAMAPLLAEVFDEEWLSPANLQRQTRFLQKLARRIG